MDTGVESGGVHRDDHWSGDREVHMRRQMGLGVHQWVDTGVEKEEGTQRECMWKPGKKEKW